MRKLLSLLFIVSLFIVACSGSKLSVSVVDAPKYIDGESSLFVVAISDGSKEVTGAEVNAVLEMARMDHGVIEVFFEEQDDGTYAGNVELPMAGEWIADIIINVDGKESTTTLTFDVNEG